MVGWERGGWLVKSGVGGWGDWERNGWLGTGWLAKSWYKRGVRTVLYVPFYSISILFITEITLRINLFEFLIL